MGQVTEEDKTEMNRLVGENLVQSGEAAAPAVVDVLAKVGVGYLAGAFGTFPPVSRNVEREQLAAFLTGTFLQGTRPSPNNNYLQIVTASGRSYLASRHPNPPVPDSAVPILATLGLGFTRETDPRATRAAATTHFIDLYLVGR